MNGVPLALELFAHKMLFPGPSRGLSSLFFPSLNAA
jgi:hypothetical protein